LIKLYRNKTSISSSFFNVATLSFFNIFTPKNDGKDLLLYQISYQEKIRNKGSEREIIYEIKTQIYLGNGSNSYGIRINLDIVNEYLNLNSTSLAQNEKRKLLFKSFLCLEGISYNYVYT